MQKMLANFEQASQRANGRREQRECAHREPDALLQQSADNFQQMTDTLKRQPWRLIWPSTKKYDEPTTTTTKVPPAQGGP